MNTIPTHLSLDAVVLVELLEPGDEEEVVGLDGGGLGLEVEDAVELVLAELRGRQERLRRRLRLRLGQVRRDLARVRADLLHLDLRNEAWVNSDLLDHDLIVET